MSYPLKVCFQVGRLAAGRIGGSLVGYRGQSGHGPQGPRSRMWLRSGVQHCLGEPGLGSPPTPSAAASQGSRGGPAAGPEPVLLEQRPSPALLCRAARPGFARGTASGPHGGIVIITGTIITRVHRD